MRLTPRRLHAWAEQVVAEKRRDLNLLAIYLTGSLLTDAPLFGGVTDIDLVCIYNLPPTTEEEVRPLPGGVHVHLRHWERDRLEPPRKLRHEVWLGHELYYARPMHDPQHFLDFVQSAARSRFHHPEVAAQRAWNLLETARATWARLSMTPDPLAPEVVSAYTEAIYQAMHIPATLHGRVLSWRRAGPQWQAEAAAAGHPEWMAQWLRALGAPGITAQALAEAEAPWAAAWEAAHQAAPHEPTFHPARRRYYQAALSALRSSEPPAQALLLLLHTWSRALQAAPAQDARQEAWRETLTRWNWHEPEAHFAALDQWLDSLETFLEAWMQAHGVDLGLV